MVEQEFSELTEHEAELYDRQIRLWGLESQKRLRSAKILIVGLNGLGAEIAKNIVLAGVKSVTLLDPKKVEELDFCSQFFIPRTELGKNRAEASLARVQVLNPMVEILTDTTSITEKGTDFFKNFDVVCVLEAVTNELTRIDHICREHNIKFFSADLWGMFGYSFADLQEHEFAEDVVKHKVISARNEKIKTEIVTSTAKRTLSFPSFENAFKVCHINPKFVKREKKTGPAYLIMRILQLFREMEHRDPRPESRETDLAKLIEIRNGMTSVERVSDNNFAHVFGQISPVAAVIGGAVAQEIIKTVSQKEAPHHNFFFFDPSNTCGFIEHFAPEALN